MHAPIARAAGLPFTVGRGNLMLGVIDAVVAGFPEGRSRRSMNPPVKLGTISDQATLRRG